MKLDIETFKFRGEVQTGDINLGSCQHLPHTAACGDGIALENKKRD